MHVVARTVAAVAGFEWSWAADQLEELVTAAGWIYRQPSEGTVSCAFDAAPGRAGAFLFGAEVTAVFLNLAESDGAGVPARRNLFVAAITEVGVQLGPPPLRCPGPDPSVGWRVAAGVLEIVDRPGVLDLWLRPAPRRVPHPPVPPFTGDVGWAELEAGLAAAAASLPAGATVWLEHSGRTLAELSQTEDSLTVRAGDGTATMRWPAAGTAYQEIAGRLVLRLREEAVSPADLAYVSDLPAPHLPLRREMRRT